MITAWIVVCPYYRIMVATTRIGFHCHSLVVDRILRARVCGRVRANDYACISDRNVTSLERDCVLQKHVYR